MNREHDAGREYAEIWGETVEANRKLRTLAMILAAACLALAVLLLRVATVEPPRPIVVRVDEVGRAEAVAYEAATAQADPLDPTTKYFLNRFIADFYSRRQATVEEHWTRSLRFLSTELANAAFTRDGAEVAAMAAGTADTEHQVEQVVLRIHPAPEAPHGATADFDLVHLRQGQETRRERWSITLRFTFLTVIPSELVVYNPMGILITYLQADRALVTEAQDDRPSRRAREGARAVRLDGTARRSGSPWSVSTAACSPETRSPTGSGSTAAPRAGSSGTFWTRGWRPWTGLRAGGSAGSPRAQSIGRSEPRISATAGSRRPRCSFAACSRSTT